MAIFLVGLIVLFSFRYLKSINFRLNKANLVELRQKMPKFYVVLSGSMEPTLKIGSIVVVLPQKNYLEGDIVSFFVGSRKDNIVTHRIAAKLYPNGISREPLFLTAGDANKDFDSQKLEGEQIIGRMLFSVPYLGSFINFIKQPYGFILLVVVPATMIVFNEIQNLKREFLLWREKTKNKKSLVQEELKQWRYSTHD